MQVLFENTGFSVVWTMGQTVMEIRKWNRL